MKIVLLLYLEEDGPAVTKLLSDQGISAYSPSPSRAMAPGRREGGMATSPRTTPK
ncbi:MAG: hypothetical protein ACWGSQ_08680 [Longimicrobiales bacterium]